MRRSTAHRPRRRRLGIATCRCPSDAPCPPLTSHGASTMLTLRRRCHAKQRGEFGEAQACYLRAIELDPEVPPAPNHRPEGLELACVWARGGLFSRTHAGSGGGVLGQPGAVPHQAPGVATVRRAFPSWIGPLWLTFTYAAPALVKKY
eukprot:COSAG01_NODE_2771_length_7101_cov_12.982148_7_plen_148_part_00